MAKLKLKYVNELIDGTGKVRRYFRRNGKQLGPLPGLVGSDEFMEAYRGYLNKKGPLIAPRQLHADSLAKLIQDYYQSRMYTELEQGTRSAYRYALEPIIKTYGTGSAVTMTAAQAEKIISKIGAEKPGMANLTRAVLRRVFKMAVKNKLRPDNPFLGIDPYSVGEHHTWSDAELQKFEAKWKTGTRERLCYDILLYTGQRVGDAVRMSRADIADGLIHVIQQKTGAELWIPIHPNLQRSIAAYPAKGLSLIGDQDGRPIKRATLSHIIRQAVSKAKLPAICVPHGLRKAAGRRLAEAGCTAKQIQAILGHRTLKEIERYTKAADQKQLARDAIAKLKVSEQ